MNRRSAHNEPLLGLLAAFAAIYFIWGSTFLAIKVVVGFLPPLMMAGTRAALAGAILYCWGRWRGAARPTRREWLNGLAAGALLFLGGHGALFWASQHVPSGLAAVLDSTIPIWVAIFDRVGRSEERAFDGRTLLGLGLGFAGIVGLHLPGASVVVPGVSVVLLAGAASWALGTVWYRGPRRPDSGVLAAALPLFGGGVQLLIVSSLAGEPATISGEALTPRALAAFAYMLVFGSLVAFSAYSWLLDVASPTAVASYAYVNPVVALLLGWTLGGEELTGATLAAVAVIIASVVLIVVGERRPPRRRRPAGVQA